MIHIRLFVLGLILIPILVACEDNTDETTIETYHRYIKIENHSDEDLACLYQRDSSHSSWEIFEVKICRKDSFALLPSFNMYNWEEDFTSYDSISLFVLNARQYGAYSYEPYDTIMKYVPILERHIVTLPDLQTNEWTIIYPSDL